ncbi:MAG: hypothetical protein JKY51_11345 [Opitutaceae bacterium]|nr:hypothetical protein [Opitutaceae bacterium]
MNKFKQLLLVLILSGIAFGFLGCASLGDETMENSVPWSRPASWENQGPGGM